MKRIVHKYLLVILKNKLDSKAMHVVNIPELCKYHSNELFWETAVEDAYHLKCPLKQINLFSFKSMVLNLIR